MRNCQRDLHGVILEELLELLLGGRIGEIANVQAATLIGTDGGSIGSLRRGSSAVGVGGIVEGGRSHVVSDIVDGRHLDGLEMTQSACG